MRNKLYARLASLVVARQNCINNNNVEWQERHTRLLARLVEDYLPSGSGFDSGTILLMDESKENKLVFSTAFHHMDETGVYSGWSSHMVRVWPSLAFGIDVTVSGEDRNDIKSYIAEAFDLALRMTVTDEEYAERALGEM